MTGKNRIMIYGPKDDGTYVVEFRTAEGDVLAISIPRTEAHVVRHFQESVRAISLCSFPCLARSSACASKAVISAFGYFLFFVIGVPLVLHSSRHRQPQNPE
jgi:hypothetical protein